MRLAFSCVFSVLPGLGLASTLPAPTADYFAFSSVSYSVSSATFVGTGADATSALSRGDFGGSTDSREETDGVGIVEFVTTPRFTVEEIIAGAFALESTSSITATGAVSPHENYAYSFGANYIPGAIAYGCADVACAGEDILLAFDYVVTNIADTTVPDPATSSASATASARLSLYTGRVDEYDWLRVLTTTSGTGTFFARLSPGDAIGFDYEIRAGGGAFYDEPSVIPLPASAWVLLSGLGLLGGLGVARRRRSV